MKENSDSLFLDSKQLYLRGWTENLIYRFLQTPDRFKYTSHFLNRCNAKEIKCYFLGRVEQFEKDPKFDAGFREQRRIDESNVREYLEEREKTKGKVRKYLAGLPEKEREEVIQKYNLNIRRHPRT